MASAEVEQHSLNIRKSARIASHDRVTKIIKPAAMGRCGYRGEVSITAAGRGKATPTPIKVLKQKYRWLSEMDDESDSDGHSCTSAGSISEEENDDSNVSSFFFSRLPEVEESQPLEELGLPPACDDLMIVREHVLQTIGVYEVLRHFHKPLRLAQFRIEDLCAALSSPDSCRLLDEVHVALLRVVVRNDEAAGTMFASTESKDSVAIVLFFGMSDPITWFELCRLYMNCFPSNASVQQALTIFGKCSSYIDVSVEERLIILQLLVDLFLATDVARDFLSRSNTEIEHESVCRSCNRVGELLCCDVCPAVYHLECIKPPLTDVPEEDWTCPICEQLHVEGVSDCVIEQELVSPLLRHEPMGYDRHGRIYWFICRRVIVNGNDGSVWYYSSPDQLDELRRVLGSSTNYPIEVDLLNVINEMREEIVIHMNVTAQLVERFRGSKKSAIHVHDDLIAKCRNEAVKNDEVESNIQHQSGTADLVRVCVTKIDLNGVNESDFGDVKNEDCHEKTIDNDSKIAFDQKCSEFPKLTSAMGPTDSTSTFDIEQNYIAVVESSYETSLKSDIFQGRKQTSSFTESLVALSDSNAVAESKDDFRVNMGVENECFKDVSSNASLESSTSFPAWNCKIAPVYESSATSSKPGVAVRVTRSMTGNLPRVREQLSPTPAARRSWTRVKTNDQRSSLFKLGMEGTFMKYVNLFRTEALAQGKQQKSDERDKRRQLSYRFSMSCPEGGEFSWNGPLYSNISSKLLFVDAMRYAILSLDAQIATPFLHSGWRSRGNSERWARAVRLCKTPRDFGTALSILVMSMKPVIFNSTWKESVGHTSFCYSTLLEREEQKKRERDQKRYKVFEDGWLAMSKVHYTLGLHHQVWKQRDEEYRIFGNGGWFWLSSTRSRRQDSIANTEQSDVGACHLDKSQAGKSKSMHSRTLHLDQLLDRRLRPLRAQARAMIAVGQQVKKFVTSEIEKHKLIQSTAELQGEAQRLQQYFCYSTACKNNRALGKDLCNCYSISCRASSYLNRVVTEKENAAANGTGVSDLEEAVSSSVSEDGSLNLNHQPNGKTANVLSTQNIDSMIVYNVDTRLPVVIGPPNSWTSSGVKKVSFAIPVANKFMARSGQTSIFILECRHLRKLARRGGLKFEPPGFAHSISAKSERCNWPYPGPKPLFYQAWYYRTATASNLSAIALQVRVVRCCLRWDDMQFEQSPSLLEEVDGDVQTRIEIKEKRDLEPDGLRSEYLVRRITAPLNGNSETQGDRPASQRTGLRERVVKVVEPVITEAWTPEEDIELWRLKDFAERGYRPRRIDGIKGVSSQKSASDSKRKRAVSSEDDDQSSESASVSARRSSRFTGRKRVAYDQESSDSDSLESFSAASSTQRQLNRKYISSSVRYAGGLGKTNAFSASRVLARSNAAAILPNQNIRAVKGPDGTWTFTGLLPGQKVVQQANGHYKLLIPQTVAACGGNNLQTMKHRGSNENLSGDTSSDNGVNKRSREITDTDESMVCKKRRLTMSEAHKLLMHQLDSEEEHHDDAGNSVDKQEMPTLIKTIQSSFGEGRDPNQSFDATDRNESSDLSAPASTLTCRINKSHQFTPYRPSTKVSGPMTPPIDPSTISTDLISQKKLSSSPCFSMLPTACSQSANTTPSKENSASKSWIISTSAAELVSAASSLSTSDQAPLCVVAETFSLCATSSRPDVSTTRTVDAEIDLVKPELYCVCRTPYDETKLYIGCESCEDWFHPSCVGVIPEDVELLTTYMCPSCDRTPQAAQVAAQKLYCVCHTPYNSKLTYISCNRCHDWYHPECVNLSKERITQMSEWHCTKCSQIVAVKYGKVHDSKTNLNDHGWQQIVCLLHKLKLESCDIKDPRFPVSSFINFEPLEKRIVDHKYNCLEDFVTDVLRLFGKVRHSHNETTLKRRAVETFELSFVNEIKSFRSSFAFSQR